MLIHIKCFKLCADLREIVYDSHVTENNKSLPSATSKQRTLQVGAKLWTRNVEE
jgi:hypothetical protein